MPAAIIPALIMAGGTIGASALASHAQSEAMKRTPLETSALQGQVDLQQQQLKQSRQLYDSAKPASDAALNYHTSLLSGDRGKMDAALRPQVSAINDTTMGAEEGLKAQGVTGGVLRQGLGRIATERQRQIGGVYADAPGKAAVALGSQTQGLMGIGNAAGGNAGMTGANILVSEGANRDRGYAAGSSSAKQFGGLIATLMSQYGKRGLSAGGAGV